MKLIYLSYALMDQGEPPEWVVALKNHPVVKKERWCFYDPMLSFSENLQSDVYVAASLSDSRRINAVAMSNATTQLHDNDLLKPLTDVLPRIKAAEAGPSLDIVFKNIYAIMRSDILLVDLNVPEHGEKSQEVRYAYLSGVPVVGVSHRFIVSPWMVNMMNTVVFPRTTDSIVLQVLAHDRKNTDFIDLTCAHAVGLLGKGQQISKETVEAARELRKTITEAREDLRAKGGVVGGQPAGEDNVEGSG